MIGVRILVTGGAGLIGSNLANYLSKLGATVVIADNLTGGSRVNIPKNVTLEVIDLTKDVTELDAMFKRYQFNYVYHCAAYAAEGLSPFLRKFNYENNLISTANVVNKCITYKVDRLIYFSSMAVYGDYYSPPFSEDMSPRPIDPYGIAKYAGEMDIMVAARQHGLKYCIIRPHNFYGPGQNVNDQYRNVLGIWMKAAMNNLPIKIYGDGLQQRAFSYIGDAMRPLWLAAVSEYAEGEIINLGGIEPTQLIDAAKLIKDICGSESDIIHLEARHEVKYAYSTYKKSVELLDFKHITQLQRGLELMYDWVKSTDLGTFLPYSWGDAYEITDGLYSYWKSEL